MLDPKLKDYAHPAQSRYIDAVNEHGTYAAAAQALNLNVRTLQRAIKVVKARAALQGISTEHDMTHAVPDGFKVKGVSTYYDRDGKPIGQWVKSSADNERREELLRAMVEAMLEEVRGLSPIQPPPAFGGSKLLALYAFGDPHFGMYAWAEECGEDFDLATADRLTRAGIDRMTAVAPEAETALLLMAGDNTHGDNTKNATPGHGFALDVDTRHPKVMLTVARATIYAVRRALEKHLRVIVWNMPGNHDPETAPAIALALALYFENEPRVTVDLSPGLFKYMRHGKVLIGAHHGHGAKQADLPLLMAVDRPEDWGASTYRYVYMGHIHHDSVKEIQGVRVESLRTLAAKDAWHSGKGYRSMRDTRLIALHADFGEVERHTCSVAMLEAA